MNAIIAITLTILFTALFFLAMAFTTVAFYRGVVRPYFGSNGDAIPLPVIAQAVVLISSTVTAAMVIYSAIAFLFMRLGLM
jgi:hypothetical protein